MATVKEKAVELQTALEAVEWRDHPLRATHDPGETMNPPQVLLGPPRLEFNGQGPEPTQARFLVYVLVDVDDRAMEYLWELVPLCVEAIETVVDAIVRTADPSTFPSGGSDLPAYAISVEVDL